MKKQKESKSKKNIKDNFVPLYEKLASRYRNDIIERRLKFGDRLDSITTVQSKHQVSRETAKKVLGILADEGWIIQKPGLGSFVADVGPKQHLWGIIIPFYNIQYEQLISQITNEAAKLDREVIHFCDYNNYQEEIKLVGRMLSENYEAIIVVPSLDESKTQGFYSKLSPKDSPVILLDHTMTNNSFPCVIQSYGLGVHRGLRYLDEKKSGNIAFVRDEVWGTRNMVQELMEETYIDYIQRNRSWQEPIVFTRVESISSGIIKKGNISSFFCCDDVNATHLLGKLKEEGTAIPKDINMVSYGNTHLAKYFTPAITSIDPYYGKMTDYLMEMLQQNIKEEKVENNQIVISPDLVVRDT